MLHLGKCLKSGSVDIQKKKKTQLHLLKKPRGLLARVGTACCERTDHIMQEKCSACYAVKLTDLKKSAIENTHCDYAPWSSHSDILSRPRRVNSRARNNDAWLETAFPWPPFLALRDNRSWGWVTPLVEISVRRGMRSTRVRGIAREWASPNDEGKSYGTAGYWVWPCGNFKRHRPQWTSRDFIIAC